MRITYVAGLYWIRQAWEGSGTGCHGHDAGPPVSVNIVTDLF